MNNITTCPQCLTRFIVGRAQLKANQGQVKCTKCKHEFDFRQHLESSHEQTVFLGATLLKVTRQKQRIYLLITLLTLLAFSQILFFTRTNIATIWPASQPVLIKACQLLHCQIPFPKNIELITLDDTDLIKEESVTDVFKFSGLLTNSAPYAQAYPALELTLTDPNDRAIIRKWIAPTAYAKNIKDGLKAGEDLPINIKVRTMEAVAGFRVAPIYR